MDSEQLHNSIELVCDACLNNINVCSALQKEVCYHNFKLMYKMGYNDAVDKYQKRENEIQIFRRSGHP